MVCFVSRFGKGRIVFKSSSWTADTSIMEHGSVEELTAVAFASADVQPIRDRDAPASASVGRRAGMVLLRFAGS